jgi:hypothetical protein
VCAAARFFACSICTALGFAGCSWILALIRFA